MHLPDLPEPARGNRHTEVLDLFDRLSLAQRQAVLYRLLVYVVWKFQPRA